MSHLDTAFKLGAVQAEHDFGVELQKLGGPPMAAGGGGGVVPPAPAPTPAPARSLGRLGNAAAGVPGMGAAARGIETSPIRGPQQPYNSNVFGR